MNELLTISRGNEVSSLRIFASEGDTSRIKLISRLFLWWKLTVKKSHPEITPKRLSNWEKFVNTSYGPEI